MHIVKLTLIVAVVLIVLGGLLFRHFNRTKEKSTQLEQEDLKAPLDFYSIYDGNQNELIYVPAYNKAWFNELNQKYTWDKFNTYDNRFWEYMYQLSDTLPGIAGKTV